MTNEIKIRATIEFEYTVRLGSESTPQVLDDISNALAFANMDLIGPEEIPNLLELDGIEVVAHDMDSGSLVGVEYEMEEVPDGTEKT